MPVYNSGTAVDKMSAGETPAERRGVSSTGAGTSSQYGLDMWSGNPRIGKTTSGSIGIINRAPMPQHDNLTFDPYKGHLSILKNPNVNYGPLEDPSFIGPNLDKYADSLGTNYYLKIEDPLGRSSFEPISQNYPAFGGEISLLQMQGTMNELKNRIEIESTAAYNRNLPPAARINRFTTLESQLSRILPDVMDESKTTVVKNTRIPLPMHGRPYMSSGAFYNLKTGRIESPQQARTERAFGKKMMATPPELIEDFIEENMSWQGITQHKPDYKESPDTTDTTKETIKTMEQSGKVITTDIGDNSFTKNVEYDGAKKKAAAKEASLQEKMTGLKKKGYLLGIK